MILSSLLTRLSHLLALSNFQYLHIYIYKWQIEGYNLTETIQGKFSRSFSKSTTCFSSTKAVIHKFSKPHGQGAGGLCEAEKL